ncbi:chromosome segregation protein SMC [Candidatus Woesearchaeota archaeon]|nr:chromosome segregation protein SMC [Candidatus Woesearchaeota archaeon]
MTHINRIVMKGFKSFGKRTELVFGGNFNCILGPNGSGKSNVLDALAFVLGKAGSKGLRAEKSANLIYNGGKSKPAMKEGEVSIFFDNASKVFPTEDAVVKLTRLIAHDGTSTYKINDKTRTRQQMLDLLSAVKIDPDGYNIIMQGDITRLIEMSPAERRQIVEEIAGILVYEEKKEKAVKELEKVEAKMKEADILLTERKVHLDELREDRDHALKYKKLKDSITQNKASYVHLQLSRRSKEKEKLDAELQGLTAKMDALRGDITQFRSAIEEKRTAIQGLNQEMEKRTKKEQLDISKQVEQLKVEIAAKQNRAAALEHELGRLAQRKEQLSKSLSESESKIGEMERSRKEMDKHLAALQKEEQGILVKIAAFKKKNKLDDLSGMEKDIDALDAEAEQKQKEVNALKEAQQQMLREADKLELFIRTMDEKIAKVLGLQKEHKAQLQELQHKRDRMKQATVQLNQLLAQDSSHAVQLDELKAKLAAQGEELSRLEVRHTTIKEASAGESAVQAILSQRSSFGGVYGTIAELGQVPSRYAFALEVAAGARLKNIVVDTDATAVKCINYLKEHKLGTATFIPLNKIREPEQHDNLAELADAKGVHGLALGLISFDHKFKKAFSYVFGNTLVVDDLAVARRIGITRAKMVTLDGDSAEMSGVLHGGFRQRRKGMGFQEQESASTLSSLQGSVEQLRKRISSLESERAEGERTISALRHEKSTLEGEIIKTERSLHLEDSDMDANKEEKGKYLAQKHGVEERLTQHEQSVSMVNAALLQLKSRKQQIRDKVAALRNPAVIAEIAAFEQKRNELLEEIRNLSAEAKGMDIQITDIHGRDKENTLRILKQHEKEERDFREEMGAISQVVSQSKKDLAVREAEERKFYAQFGELFKQRDALEEDIKKIEGKIDLKNEALHKLELRQNTVSLTHAAAAAAIAGMEQEFAQYAGVALVQKPEEELKKEIAAFERMMVDIGNVNLRALEVYDSVEQAYGELLKKKEVLMAEKEDVTHMMAEIEQKKGSLFMQTFSSINENFQRVFGMISNKGSTAYLELEDPEQPFAGGVTIKVRITGTKFLDLRSLSGGEKTLTALAFLFAVQEHEPASFYVLDEVDAALDKHNSERLAKLIREYANKAQYILISHNDAMVSEADTLYGVSMDKDNVSAVVSLRL